ncbi:hypothetical protein [Agitococcus lubricus]|uniref:Uncharacterized protein n=1 Tax=Agitococcus lubricus TaxID=1077255 RepID=A0A2T5J3D9_9GAMM|nr:hypothetical protein [Agitococcus lubricus]PTQ91134.1 hypothetical protein C8N29_101206 [Agitococcus lubricus]
MIDASTLALTQPSIAQHLPAFWRLARLNTGLPLLWPITYQQAIVIRHQLAHQEAAYQLVENCLLSLWQHGAAQLEFTVYQHSLRPAFPYFQQLSSSSIRCIYHKKQFKDYLEDLHTLLVQRQQGINSAQVLSDNQRLAIPSATDKIQIVVISQLWPDVELLTRLLDICQYGLALGVVPILLLSEHYFPKHPVDEWQTQLLALIEQITTPALVMNVHAHQRLTIEAPQLQPLAALYDFFQPVIEYYDAAVYQHVLDSSAVYVD